jgi:hypothetical protein
MSGLRRTRRTASRCRCSPSSKPLYTLTGVGILEWLGAHLLAPLVNLYRAFQARPRPDLRIVELTPTGGGTHVDFDAYLQNYGNQPTRATVVARVGDQEIQVAPQVVDLLANAPPTRVAIYVPRPQIGDLVKELNEETTLYDQTLIVEATAGKQRAAAKWHELVYDPETNRERHKIQRRVWRRGRGEETPDDRHEESVSERERKRDEGT